MSTKNGAEKKKRKKKPKRESNIFFIKTNFLPASRPTWTNHQSELYKISIPLLHAQRHLSYHLNIGVRASNFTKLSEPKNGTERERNDPRLHQNLVGWSVGRSVTIPNKIVIMKN